MARLPAFFEPQLATLVKTPPAGDGYAYEIKYDGYRMLCRVDEKGVRFFSRNGNDWTEKLQHLANGIGALNLGTGWLDGEIVIFGENGISDFNRLQNLLDRRAAREIRYVVFDIPYWGGADLRRVAFIQRAGFLKALMDGAGGGPIIVSTVVPVKSAADAAALVAQACEMGMEGLMGKRKDSPYRSGRTNTWIKLPCRKKDEFIVVGWTTGEGSRAALGALLLAQYDDTGVLRYAGTVGSGFGSKTRTTDDLMKMLKARMVDTPAFEGKISKSTRWGGARDPGFFWVRPDLIVDVAFKERTRGGQLRQSSFLGIREDKPASLINRERPGRAARR